MNPSISVNEKKRGRGRPATGTDPAVAVRLPPAVLAAVDQWAKSQTESRSEAIRRLVEHGLNVVKVNAQVAANRAAHASKQAAGIKTAAKKTRPRA
jgi:hypothetical protein